MNSTEFYIAAGEAIAEWGKTHRAGCLLSLNNGSVMCVPLTIISVKHGGCRRVSALEVKNGMKSNRWEAIGTELSNLYDREAACQKPQKP